MLKELPRFRGFIVDVRLKEFRSFKFGKLIFIKFETEEGTALLKEYLEEIDEENEHYEAILKFI